MTRKSATMLLPDMEYGSATARMVEQAILGVPGVSRAYVNPATEAAYVEYDADQCAESDFMMAVESLGFRAVASSPRATAAFSRSPESHTMPNANRNSRLWWAFAGFLAIAAFFLLQEHRAHILGLLPYALVLACPLLHFAGHGGHGHGTHASHDEHRGSQNDSISHETHSG